MLCMGREYKTILYHTVLYYQRDWGLFKSPSFRGEVHVEVVFRGRTAHAPLTSFLVNESKLWPFASTWSPAPCVRASSSRWPRVRRPLSSAQAGAIALKDFQNVATCERSGEREERSDSHSRSFA